MPIPDATIRYYGKPFIVFTSSNTLREALKGLKESGYAPNEAYLVVLGSDSPAEYYVQTFLQIIAYARLVDYDSLDTPLGALPWPPASRVVPANTQERVNNVLLWMQSNPNSRVLITRDSTVVGLFATADLATFGFFDRFGISRLHGDWIDLTQDPRAVFEARAEKPTCPGCTTKQRFHYEISELVCPNCGYKVKLL